MSPFEIVYGFNPNSPIDLTPLPPAEIASLEGESRAEFIKKIHKKAKENIEKRTEAYAKNANKGRKQVSFKEGDWVWLHMRTERFPQKRKNKLAPRGDGPFRVLKKINDNAYQLDLPGEFNVSSTFNVVDLELFDAGEDPVLRTKPFEEGGNDEDISSSSASSEPDQGEQVEIIPQMPSGPLTRQRARVLKHKFGLLVEHVLRERPDGSTKEIPAGQEEQGETSATHGQPVTTCGQGSSQFLNIQTSTSGVFTIILE